MQPTEPQIITALRAVKWNGEDIVTLGMVAGITFVPEGQGAKVNLVLQIEPQKGAVAVARSAEQSRGDRGGDAVTNYVLGTFAKADRMWLEQLLDALASNLHLLLEGKTDKYLAHLPGILSE